MQDFEFKTSESSVSRIIKALNIKNKTQKPKEKLNQRQKDNRILFCKNLLKNELYSFPFVFTDESMIALDPIKKKIKILPYIDNDEYFYEKSGYPLKIMIWGAIAKDFKSPLILIDGKLNSIKYIKMLEDNNIFHLLNKRFGNNGYVFQQDGASSHTAAITINFLSQKVKLLKDVIKWPANSPDLNVIEIIWAIIKSRINIEKVENKKDLFEKVKQIWDEIPIETINLLIDSFHSRIKTCIQLNGESLNGKKKVMKKFGILTKKEINFLKIKS